MNAKTCDFSTQRLHVSEWHRQATRYSLSLATVIQQDLTPKVTQYLPPHWQSEFTNQRIPGWIEERDNEGAILLVVDIATESAIGFLTLFESTDSDFPQPTIRLGYVIAEPYWGQGIATELVGGFLQWAADNGIRRILSGIDIRNGGSKRVLEKCGFTAIDPDDSHKPGEEHFTLNVA